MEGSSSSVTRVGVKTVQLINQKDTPKEEEEAKVKGTKIQKKRSILFFITWPQHEVKSPLVQILGVDGPSGHAFGLAKSVPGTAAANLAGEIL